MPFVLSSNGHMFVSFDVVSGQTTTPRPMTEFPSPAVLRATPDRDDRGVDYSHNGCPGCGRVRVFRIVREDPVT
jgi:hypothetical protein